jgi:hypothetical protein
LAGIAADSTFRKVVFPLPVPPDITILSLAFTAACKKSAISSVKEPKLIKSAILNGSLLNFLIEITGPFKETGGITAFTRLPSRRRASTMGELSSILRPIGAIIRSMICLMWS